MKFTVAFVGCVLLFSALSNAQPTPAPRPRPTAAPASGNATSDDDASATSAVKWCTADANETAICERAVRVMNGLDAGLTFGCYEIPEDGDCLAAIQEGDADIANFGSGDIYAGSRENDLVAILSTNNDDPIRRGSQYYAVVVTLAENCAAGETLASQLRGKSSCHTGYRRTAGWQMAVGRLLAEGAMPVVAEEEDVANDAESAAAFFGDICAVGTRDEDAAPQAAASGDGAQLFPPLCSACDNPANCSATDIYSDYAGTIRGVMEGACDAAFTKHDTMLEVVGDGTAPEEWSSVPKSGLRLVCADGSCGAIDDWPTCNLARVPTSAILTRADYEDIPGLQQALIAATEAPAVQRLLFNNETNPEGYLLPNDIVGLELIEGDTATYLDTAGIALEGIDLAANANASAPAAAAATDDDLAAGVGGTTPDGTSAAAAPSEESDDEIVTEAPISGSTPAAADQASGFSAAPAAAAALAAAVCAAVLA